jgi:hypothetical protein
MMLNTSMPGASLTSLPIVPPNLLPQNALPGAIFGDGVPNLLLQGSLQAADIPLVRIPGRLAVSYEGGAGAETAQPERPNSPVSSLSAGDLQQELDEAFAEFASQPEAAQIFPN